MTDKNSAWCAAAISIPAILLAATAPAVAQAVKCSAFLHGADGSWRSFETATVQGSNGPVKVQQGQVVKRGGARETSDIAKILDEVCGG